MNTEKKLLDLEENYNLEIDRAIQEIKKKKAKRVLLQVPDFFKPYATPIAEKLETPNSQVFIYFGSCFGACDIPLEEARSVKADMIIQLGHSPWNFKKKG